MYIHVVEFYSVFEMYGRYLMEGYRLFCLFYIWKMENAWDEFETIKSRPDIKGEPFHFVGSRRSHLCI